MAKEQVLNKLGSSLATFKDLNKRCKKRSLFKNINLIVFNVNKEVFEIFNAENTPHMPLAFAVRICMSCFTTYSMVEIIDQVTNRKSLYLDGGIILQNLNA